MERRSGSTGREFARWIAAARTCTGGASPNTDDYDHDKDEDDPTTALRMPTTPTPTPTPKRPSSWPLYDGARTRGGGATTTLKSLARRLRGHMNVVQSLCRSNSSSNNRGRATATLCQYDATSYALNFDDGSLHLDDDDDHDDFYHINEQHQDPYQSNCRRIYDEHNSIGRQEQPQQFRCGAILCSSDVPPAPAAAAARIPLHSASARFAAPLHVLYQ